MHVLPAAALLSVALCLSPAAGQSRAPVSPDAMQDEQRVALVIGNGAYHDGRLLNPPNDARAMAATLRHCRFEVTELLEVARRGTLEALRTFGEQIKRGGVALFYFARHGLQVGGRNYLVPVGADIQRQADVEFECVDAGRVLSYMQDAGNRINVIILDACRNNPFARSFRSGTRGLRKMDVARDE